MTFLFTTPQTHTQWIIEKTRINVCLRYISHKSLNDLNSWRVFVKKSTILFVLPISALGNWSNEVYIGSDKLGLTKDYTATFLKFVFQISFTSTTNIWIWKYMLRIRNFLVLSGTSWIQLKYILKFLSTGKVASGRNLISHSESGDFSAFTQRFNWGGKK